MGTAWRAAYEALLGLALNDRLHIHESTNMHFPRTGNHRAPCRLSQRLGNTRQPIHCAQSPNPITLVVPSIVSIARCTPLRSTCMSLRSQNIQFAVAWFVIALSLRTVYSPEDFQGLGGWWLTQSEFEATEPDGTSTFYHREDKVREHMAPSTFHGLSMKKMRTSLASLRQSRPSPARPTSRTRPAVASGLAKRLSARKQGAQEGDSVWNVAHGQAGLAKSAMAHEARRFLFRSSTLDRAIIHVSQPRGNAFGEPPYFTDALLAMMPLMILNSLLSAGGALRRGDNPSRHVKRDAASHKESRGTARRRLSREQPVAARIPRTKADPHMKAARFLTRPQARRQRFIAVKM